MHGGHTVLIKEIVDEISVCLDFFPLGCGLTHDASCVGIDIKCTFGCRAAEPRRIVQHCYHKVPSLAESRVAFAQKVLRAVQRGEHGILADGARVAGRLRLQIRHRLDEPSWTTSITNAPTRHGIGLGSAIHGQCAIIKVGTHLKHRRKRLWRIPDMLIHVVGQQHDMRILQQHRAKCLEFCCIISCPGRVRR